MLMKAHEDKEEQNLKSFKIHFSLAILLMKMNIKAELKA